MQRMLGTSKKMINHRRNNKIAIRNFSESQDFHDIVKTIFVRMLRRKNPDNKNTAIYTEYDDSKPNESYPDVKMVIKKSSKPADEYVWEIQKEITREWLEKSIQQHENVNLEIIPIKKIEEKYKKFLDELKEDLEKYLV